MKDDRLLKDLLSAFPEALASPFTRWHEDDIEEHLTSERMAYEHEERLMEMQYQHEERMELAEIKLERMKMIRVAMENGYIHPMIAQECYIPLPEIE